MIAELTFSTSIELAVVGSATADLISTEYMLRKNIYSYESNPLGQTLDKRAMLKLAQTSAFIFVSRKADATNDKNVKRFARLIGVVLTVIQIKDTFRNIRIAHKRDQ